MGLRYRSYQPNPDQCQEIRLSEGGFTDAYGIEFNAEGLIVGRITSLDAVPVLGEEGDRASYIKEIDILNDILQTYKTRIEHIHPDFLDEVRTLYIKHLGNAVESMKDDSLIATAAPEFMPPKKKARTVVAPADMKFQAGDPQPLTDIFALTAFDLLVWLKNLGPRSSKYLEELEKRREVEHAVQTTVDFVLEMIQLQDVLQETFQNPGHPDMQIILRTRALCSVSPGFVLGIPGLCARYPRA